VILQNKLEIVKELMVVAYFMLGLLFWYLLGVRIDDTVPRIKSGTPIASVILTCPVPTHETWNYRTRSTGWFPHSPVLPLVVPWIVTLGFLTACVVGSLRKCLQSRKGPLSNRPDGSRRESHWDPAVSYGTIGRDVI
jgi:hypothetical protein